LKKTYFKLLLLAVICGIINCLYLFASVKKAIPFSTIINHYGLNDFYIFSGYLIFFFRWYFPIILFQIIWGTYIYRHFCSASVYHFSRCNNRAQWFLKEAVHLYVYAILYLMVLIATPVILFSIYNKLTFDSASFILLAYYMIIYSLWIFIFTLLVNILSIRFSSITGFSIISAIQMLCVSVFIVLQDLNILTYELKTASEIDNLELQSKIIKFNPLSHIVLKYHKSGDQALNKIINTYGFSFYLYESVLLLFVIAIIAVVAGYITIKKKDLITNNQEMDG
jgi:hypothetical protein